jgi:hypothetical protein
MNSTTRTHRIAGVLCAAAAVLPASATAMPTDFAPTTTTGAAAARASSLDAARSATAKYRHLKRAKHDGYAILKDAKGIACIDQPGEGGMGVHFVNGDLVGDSKVKARTPEALVYDPSAGGKKRLVALEYVVFQEGWDKAHGKRPRLFGHRFSLVKAGNRYGLPAFYELHAWIFKKNPSGKFYEWNPRVSC